MIHITLYVEKYVAIIFGNLYLFRIRCNCVLDVREFIHVERIYRRNIQF